MKRMLSLIQRAEEGVVPRREAASAGRIRSVMRRNFWVWVAALLAAKAMVIFARAADGAVNVKFSGTNVLLRVDGDKDDDWWIQTSTNCATWTTLTNFGTLLSGNETNAPWRSAGARSDATRFYRARQTVGLYDATLLRTWSLTFTQANFSNLMVLGRTYSTNAHCKQLTLDNGATNTGIGARFRGNTSFSGTGGPGGTSSAPVKKSIAIEIAYANTNADLMGYDNINLNNAYGDETIMRETVYFNVMRQYAVCPAGCLAQLSINGANWGVYSCAQQQDGTLINEFFPSNNGDRFRAANMSESAAFKYLGNTNVSSYTPYYELKSTYHTNAWPRFINAIYVFNNLAAGVLRDKAEDVIAVDRWLWFLALENLFVDEDSYWSKGSDYILYVEPETGRVHPVEHDGNEALTTAQQADYTLSPIYGSTLSTRPVLYRLLSNAELKQRYLAHMRTVLEENFNPGTMTALIDGYHARSIVAVIADPKKGITMAAYTNDLKTLKTFVTNRYNTLIANTNLTPRQPNITAVSGPSNAVFATNAGWVAAAVSANGNSGVGSVWLYHRGKGYGRFTWTQMFDDGAHQDGLALDGVYGAATTNYPAGTKVRYYIEARGTNAAARFSPARAEEDTYNYHVALPTAASTPVVINELMADNETTVADPQGEHEDWIELRNLTDQPVSLTGRYLSDEAGNARKWPFPAGTIIAANGYLILWADEDTTATPGLHTSFKLGKSGETLYLTDTDANLNQVLDSVTYGAQAVDVSYGRAADDADVWTTMSPTPNAANR